MKKLGKYNLNVLIKIFKQLSKNNFFTDIDEVAEDKEIIIEIYDFLTDSLAINDQDDKEFIIAAFYENYIITDGNFDLLGDTIAPVTPKKRNYIYRSSHRQESIVFQMARAKSYLPSFVKWDAYDGNLDLDITEEDVRDTWDYEDNVEED